MSGCSCSPDSSTQQRRKKRKRNDLTWEESTEIDSFYEKKRTEDIQNDAINSTQDIEKKSFTPKRSKNNKSKLRSRFKTKLKHLNLTAYNPILELNEIEGEFKDWSKEHLVLELKSLSEFVEDKRQLGKEIFHIINKKEFKKLLPKRLKKYNARDVRSWCLSEIEESSQESLLGMLKEDDYNPVNAVSSQKKSMGETKTQNVEHPVVPVPLLDEGNNNDKDSTAVDKSAEENMNQEESTDQKQIIDQEGNTDKEKGIDQEQNTDQGGLTHDASEMKTDPELFQDIIKSPDQNEIDELLNEEIPCKSEENDDDTETTKMDVDERDEHKQAVLEMELRARALKSLIIAQEKKRNASNK